MTLTKKPMMQNSINSTGDLQNNQALIDFSAALNKIIAVDLNYLFTATVPATSNCFVLINAGQCIPNAVEQFVSEHALEAEPLFLTMPEAESAAIGPWLISLPKTPTSNLIHRIVEFSVKHHAVSLFSSPFKGYALYPHLRSFMHCEFEDGSTGMLRYFDPRVGFELVTNWSSELQQRFIAPFDFWSSWDRSFTPIIRLGKSLKKALAPADQITISNYTVIHLQQSNQADLLLALNHEDRSKIEQPSPIEDIAPCLQYALAVEALGFAKERQLHSQEERLSLIKNALTIHPTFYKNRKFISELLHLEPIGNRVEVALKNMSQNTINDWNNQRLARLNDYYRHLTERISTRQIHSIIKDVP